MYPMQEIPFLFSSVLHMFYNNTPIHSFTSLTSRCLLLQLHVMSFKGSLALHIYIYTVLQIFLYIQRI